MVRRWSIDDFSQFEIGSRRRTVGDGAPGFALTSARIPYFATTVHSRQDPIQVEQRL